MTDPTVGPGTPRSAVRAWLDDHPGKDNKPKRLTPDQRRKRYNERQKQVMRRRRKDPVIKAKEALGIKARDTAYRRLAAAFPDDYLRILNAERINQGLGRLVQRKRTRTVTNTTLPAKDAALVKDAAPVPDTQPPPPIALIEEAKAHGVDASKCPHNRGLNKFSYGKFCKLCGRLIK